MNYKLNISFVLNEIYPNMFFVKFNSQDNMCNTFVRYQEMYDSSSEKFRNKIFLLEDYKKWYAENLGDNKTYSYNKDWCGFNIPSNKLDIFLGKNFRKIKDINEYDIFMKKIYDEIRSKTQENFYLISGDSELTMKHEFAHGMFYLDYQYKADMIDLINKLPTKIVEKISDEFKSKGYNKFVINDEIQAYLSTENQNSLKRRFGETIDNSEFVKIFREYYAVSK
jgi:hypothetical protein